LKIDSNENIFVFKFYSIEKDFEYRVYSIGRENMIKFLQHHNLMNFINDIRCCGNDGDVDNGNLRREFSFCSNKKEFRNKTFKIFTTSEIVEYAVDKVSQRLCDTLVFGSMSTRTDIKFIDIINECVNKLPHAGILDVYAMINDDSINPDPYELSPVDFIYESMHSNSYSYNKEQSITIEAYARCFAEILCDEY
jgi:hypothetical protein